MLHSDKNMTKSARKFGAQFVCNLTLANESPAYPESAELIWADSKVQETFSTLGLPLRMRMI